jgi:hypothetical protein
VDLSEHIREKFNRVSRERGVDILMTGERNPTDHRTHLVKVLGWACHSDECPAYTTFPDESTCICDLLRETETDVQSAVMLNEARASLGLKPQKVWRTCSECGGAGVLGSVNCQNCDGNGGMEVTPTAA